MAIYTLCSASGSPGVSTTALGLALTWPRPVILVEADPSGSQALLAGYFKGSRKSENPDQTRIAGLLDLSVAARQGDLHDELPRMLLGVPETNAKLLVGTDSHVQSLALTRLWDELLLELQTLGPKTGQDILVDAGRLGLDGSPSPLVKRADVTLLLTRSAVRDFAGAQSWGQALLEGNVGGRYVGAVVVGPGRPYGAREASVALGVREGERIVTRMPVLGGIAWSPRHAQVLSDGEGFPYRWGSDVQKGKKFNNGHYMRSIRAVGEAARKQVQRLEDELGVPSSSHLGQWEDAR